MKNPYYAYTKEQEDLIIELYINQKRGQKYVCQMAKTTPNTMKKFLTSKGYKIRNFSEAASVSNKNRAKNKNKEFFKTQNRDMAWILGFLASDGCIRKNRNEIKIGLSSKDKEVLEKIKSKIEIENNISDYTTTEGFECSTLTWTCEEHKKDLEKYSIIPEKTFKLLPPYKLDKKYWIDYIRGYFDGDGSVNKLSNGALRWQVCSATTEILDFILDTLEEYGIPRVNIQTQNRGGNNLYSIQYSTNSTKKIYKVLYTDSDMYLLRKKKHFEEIISQETTIS